LAEKNSLLSEGEEVTAEEVVQEIRSKIFEKTQLTASAGEFIFLIFKIKFKYLNNFVG